MSEVDRSKYRLNRFSFGIIALIVIPSIISVIVFTIINYVDMNIIQLESNVFTGLIPFFIMFPMQKIIFHVIAKRKIFEFFSAAKYEFNEKIYEHVAKKTGIDIAIGSAVSVFITILYFILVKVFLHVDIFPDYFDLNMLFLSVCCQCYLSITIIIKAVDAPWPSENHVNSADTAP